MALTPGMAVFSLQDLRNAYHNFSESSDQSKSMILDYLSELTGMSTDRLDEFIHKESGPEAPVCNDTGIENVVYCSRDCVNQKEGYCMDNGIAIDNDGYCTGYIPE